MRNEFSQLNKGDKEEYLITQYLSLLAHHHGYDGIRFKSSLIERGENCVIFDTKKCHPASPKMYTLKNKYDLILILPEDEKEVIK